MSVSWNFHFRIFEFEDHSSILMLCCLLVPFIQLQAFRKDNRAILSRKELFKNTLRKAAHAWKRIIELRLSGVFSS